MILHNVIQIVFLLAGVIAILAALFDWDWFFTSNNSAPVVARLGRKKSRLLYGVLGALFIVAAVYFYYHIKAVTGI